MSGLITADHFRRPCLRINVLSVLDRRTESLVSSSTADLTGDKWWEREDEERR